MPDLSNSVIMPREDFIELTTAAYDQEPPSLGERVASVTQTYAVFGGVAALVAGTTWLVVKVLDWRETKQYEREFALKQAEADNTK